MIYWMLGIALSSAGLVLAAALKSSDMKMAFMHLAIAGAVAIYFALLGIRENQALAKGGASYSLIASNSAKFLGLIWTWGALNLALTYGTGVLQWSEWWQFLLAFLVAAGLCMFFSATLRKDAERGVEDETMLRIGRYLAIFQLVGMVIAMVGLIIDGKMTRFMDPRHTDWAANNIFFFGALAIAAVSAYELRAHRRKSLAQA